ncbi:MAG: 1-acyl-sn-glycerol-3-phosphate acyltransferase [Ignavibacteriae bacterium HGW-Ignavibacteriae-3]|nr:MAG: 1-acyl-sn-glycerol-3-phosphate acyltransferase [Ignavibacteriae bacterium HGW-Ignavibacteriae-3]
MKEENAFLNRVSANDEYITDSSKQRKKIFPSLYFFRNMLRILIYSNRYAKKGIYDSFKWYDSSVDTRESLERAGIKMHFYGMNNLRKADGPVVFVSNHMTTMETMILPSIIRPLKSVVYVIKEELSRYPLFGPIALARDPILVGRENPREDLKIVLEEGSKRLQAGKSIIIFPQRTRAMVLDAALFNSLGNKLAKRNNVPVIPIALITDAWANGKYIKELGKINPSKPVHIAFGEPIYIEGNGAEEQSKIIEFIGGKFREWGRPDLVKGV